MCVLLKLDYAKIGGFNLFFSKVIEEKPSGGVGLTPPPPSLVKEGLMILELLELCHQNATIIPQNLCFKQEIKKLD